jgi:hypothetical protein
MDLRVDDLIEHLKTFPPETRLRFVVECLNSTFCAADDYQVRRNDSDGVTELHILGAQVSPFVVVAEGEGS